jgi:hypothetical protein
MAQRVNSSSGSGSTVWGAHPLPQNREVIMTASGDGAVSLWKYQYPDQRKIKVGLDCAALPSMTASSAAFVPSSVQAAHAADNTTDCI